MLLFSGCSYLRSAALPNPFGWRPHLHYRPDSTVPPGTEVLVGAGDIAFCGLPGAVATAKLLDALPGTVFTAGDNAYPNASLSDFANCYTPTWGRHLERTRPSPGNHEFVHGRPADYFTYFGARAGDPDKGYYSYDLGAYWHVVVLNTNIEMDPGSPQERWLREDLAAHPRPCTLAYGHHPLFTSSRDSEPGTRPLWIDLYAAGAELVLAGHHHSYERFAPQTPTGNVDRTHGVRELVVGTGGAGLEDFGRTAPHSERRYAKNYGVLRLQLEPDEYRWVFIAANGRVRDSGHGRCH